MALVIDFTAQDIGIGPWAHLLWARRFGPGAECMYQAVKLQLSASSTLINSILSGTLKFMSTGWAYHLQQLC